MTTPDENIREKGIISMTPDEQQAKIKALEMKLASTTKPCPCTTYITKDSLCSACDSHITSPHVGAEGDYTEWHGVHCEVEDCNGTGVVPLVAEWRLACWSYGLKAPEGIKPCPDCNGRDWIPDLDMPKLLAWVSSQVWAVRFSPVDEIMIVCQISTEVTRKGIAVSLASSHWEALLLSCTEGAKATTA